jgi:hypothetical protein
LLHYFRDVLHRNPDIASIDLLTPTQLPTRLRFVADVVRPCAAGLPGEACDASYVALILKGFSHPAVETVPTSDRFGLSLSGYPPVNAKQGLPVAVLGVDVSIGCLDQIRRDVLRDVALSFAFTILMLGALAPLLGWRLREPLRRFMAAT